MHYLVSSLTSTAFFGLIACGTSTSQLPPTTTDAPLSAAAAADDGPNQPGVENVVPRLLPSHTPLRLSDRSDFSQWNLPAGDLAGKEHAYWSASVSADDTWNISFARVTGLEQSQVTIQGVESDGMPSAEHSHTAFLADFHLAKLQAGTAVRFNRRYTYWGRIVQLESDAAEVQYLANGKLKSRTLNLEGLLAIHTTLEEFGTPVVWRAQDGKQWLGGTAVYAAKTGVYVVTDTQQLLFLARAGLHVNVQQQHFLGDRVLAKSNSSQNWQPATVEKAFESHLAYVVRYEDNQSHTVDWAHIIALPPRL